MKNKMFPNHAAGFSLATIAFLTTLLLASGCARNRSRANEIVISGNIEVTDAQLGFKLSGRVAERPVFEGDRVKTGQLIARLDDSEQKEQLALARAELAAAEAALAELEAGSRPQEIAAAEASVRSTEAVLIQVQLDFARQKDLNAKEVNPARDLEAALANLKVAEARVAESTEHLKLVREGPRAETIQQGRARVAQARASVALAEIRLAETRIYSPLTGTVLSHSIEPGEYVSPGTPIVTVADTLHTWVRAYVNQTDLGRVQHGQKLVVHTDTAPGKNFEGTVSFISSEAEFTPKTVQTTKERVKLVFRIKVDVANPQDELKAGMPADVVLPAAP
jgi:HlyD family secretion protein